MSGADRRSRPNHLTPATASSFRFELIPPEMAFFGYLCTVREAIKTCVSRCHCWSSIYDKCEVSKEMLLEKSTKATKALEMEDIPSVRVQISAEERGSTDAGDDSELQQSVFRSRASTLSNSRVLRRTGNLRNHNKLHSRLANSATDENSETKMVAGASSSEHARNSTGVSSTLDLPPNKGLRRSGTVSGGNRPARNPGSPQLSSRKLSSQFEDVIGLFLKIVMDKLMDMMEHPPSVNILLTRLLSRLTYYPQPLLRSLLLNHQLVLKPGVPNLLSVRAWSLFCCWPG